MHHVGEGFLIFFFSYLFLFGNILSPSSSELGEKFSFPQSYAMRRWTCCFMAGL